MMKYDAELSAEKPNETWKNCTGRYHIIPNQHFYLDEHPSNLCLNLTDVYYYFHILHTVYAASIPMFVTYCSKTCFGRPLYWEAGLWSPSFRVLMLNIPPMGDHHFERPLFGGIMDSLELFQNRFY